MDQKRLMLAIALSVAILLGFQLLMPHKPTPPQVEPVKQAQTQATAPTAGPSAASAPLPGTPGEQAIAAAAAADANAPRIDFTGARVKGSISLAGARIDDLVLRDYRETIETDSPLVRLLERRSEPKPYFVQFGWSAAPGTTTKLPDSETLWTAEGSLDHGGPLTLSWNNGDGVTFRILLTLDEDYMFKAVQQVRNDSGAAVALFPYARIRRDYTPETENYYILHEGMIGVLEGRLKEMKYADARTEGEKRGGVAFDSTGTGGWAGFTDKYWLTALVPDQAVPSVASYRHIKDNGDRYQVDFVTQKPLEIAPGAEGALATRLFAGAKEVRLLDRYRDEYGIPDFDKAVDFGWFYFITKPFFYALDWLNSHLGNFGLAILVFTLGLKAAFFPLANKSYRSMSKMKLLSPKITALREQYKDDSQKLQAAMMQLYKVEKVNPASGCLPMLIQIPVFFSLYKVIFVTIEMRHAPFYGWIRDLSAIDPTNVFNLFGLIPFDPTTISPMLHLGAWPLIMGVTMFFQQKLNPPPPDPVQAKLFQFMPVLFTFMLARFPAGLVIYWSWNNTLTMAQQWVIMRQTKLSKPVAQAVSTAAKG